MKREPTSAPHTTPSNGSAERTLRLLQLLSEQGRAMTLAELAESLDLPKATTHRLCSRLEALEFIARDLDGRRFTIGAALRRLALDTLNRDLSGGLRHEVLTKLVEKVGETCNFTTLDGASVLYLDRVEAQRPWRLTLSVGVHVPLHCTASGKLFLAFLPEGEREALLERLTLDALTENTLTDVEALRASLAEIAERGYAFEGEEFVVGLIAVAVPVRDGAGTVRAAIAMHCPTTCATSTEAIDKLPSLESAARRMSELL